MMYSSYKVTWYLIVPQSTVTCSDQLGLSSQPSECAKGQQTREDQAKDSVAMR